jgi:hypothetical protein
MIAVKCLSIAGFLGVASASLVQPNLVWTGDPVASESGVGDIQVSVRASATVMTVTGSCFIAATSCDANFMWDRPFTVTSPGDFVLSESMQDSILAFNCVPDQCQPTSFASASFSGISNQGTLLSGSSSGANPGSEVIFSFSNSQSTVLTLGLGDYFLVENYSEIANGSGDISSVLNGDFSLVPMPEPRIAAYILAAALLGAVWLQARSRPSAVLVKFLFAPQTRAYVTLAKYADFGRSFRRDLFDPQRGMH